MRRSRRVKGGECRSECSGEGRRRRRNSEERTERRNECRVEGRRRDERKGPARRNKE